MIVCLYMRLKQIKRFFLQRLRGVDLLDTGTNNNDNNITYYKIKYNRGYKNIYLL